MPPKVDVGRWAGLEGLKGKVLGYTVKTSKFISSTRRWRISDGKEAILRYDGDGIVAPYMADATLIAQTFTMQPFRSSHHPQHLSLTHVCFILPQFFFILFTPFLSSVFTSALASERWTPLDIFTVRYVYSIHSFSCREQNELGLSSTKKWPFRVASALFCYHSDCILPHSSFTSYTSQRTVLSS